MSKRPWGYFHSIIRQRCIRDASGMRQGWMMVGVLILSVSCGLEKRDQDAMQIQKDGARSSLLDVDRIEALATLRKACLGSGGDWTGILLGCRCPDGHVFQSHRGCFEAASDSNIEVLAGDMLAQGSGWTLQVDTESMQEEHIIQLQKTVKSDWTRFLSGIILPDKSRGDFTFFVVGQPKRLSESYGWSPRMPSQLSIVEIDARHTIDPRHHFDFSGFVQACSAAWKDQPIHGEHIRMCQAMAYTVRKLHARQITLSDFDLNYVEEGENCSSYCTLVGHAFYSGKRLLYNVVMHNFVPTARYLVLEERDHARLLVYLSSYGEVTGIELTRFKPNPDAMSYDIMTVHNLCFDGRWKLLLEESYSKSYTEDLKHAILSSKAPAALPTDVFSNIEDIPVRALIIDGGIDPKVPGLASRLNWNRRTLEEWKLGKSFPKGNFLSYPRNFIDHWLDILDPGTGHGTQMASILAAGLPYMKLDLIRTEEFEDFRYALRSWIETIQSSQAQVVNISQEFSHTIVDCNAFFGALFSRLPQTLFVVSMGNSGVQNPVTTCPVGIAFQYPHVLTVAGMDPRVPGKLNPGSNYGKRTAKVAAPFMVPCVGAQIPYKPGHAKVKKCYGTSASAAQVSNRALRLRARHPQWSAAQSASAIQKACRPQGLDVACGGEIDFDILDRL